MSSVTVVLKNGNKVEGADEADWQQDLRYVGANGEHRMVTRLVCKLGERIVGRFNGDEIAGYSVDIR